MQGRAIVLRGDALNLPLPDESVDLIVTSPPYFALRSYTDGGGHYEGQVGGEETPQKFLDALWAATAEMARVLKPCGSIFVNLGDKYAGSGSYNNAGLSTAGSTLQGTKQQSRTGGSGARPHPAGGGEARRAEQRAATRRNAPDAYNKATIGGARPKSLMGLPWRYALGCVDDLNLILRAEIVWSKPNGLPESVADRVRRSHEQWFHFTKEGRYFAAVDEVREPHSPVTVARSREGRAQAGKKMREGQTTAGTGMRPHTFLVDQMQHPLGKLPGSVWTIATEPLKVPDHLGIDHFAAFPTEFPRRFILGWSPSGICVKCGEGRRPVIETHGEAPDRREQDGYDPHAGGRRAVAQWVNGENPNPRTIAGYECDCPDITAPTEPAVVLDPFGGTGTTALVARALGRVGVSVDLSLDYCRLARWRTSESKQARKALERTWAERQGVLSA